MTEIPGNRESTPKPEEQGKGEFTKSFLVESQPDLENIESEAFRRRITLLHDAAKASVLTPDQWRAEYQSILHSGYKNEQIKKDATPFLLNIANYLQRVDEQTLVGKATLGPDRAEPQLAGLDRLTNKIEDLVSRNQETIDLVSRGLLETRDALNQSQQRTAQAVEGLRGLPQEKERERWIDAEYNQDFYTRFQPNQEPKFYTLLSEEERRVFDARWQLARAAFVKKATSGFPDKYRENQDLMLFGKEQMERLYKIEGVKDMLRAYAKAIVEGERFTLKDGNNISFWEIKDAKTFETFRESLRRTYLTDGQFGSLFQRIPEDSRRVDGLQPEKWKGWWINLFKKEADAAAWNLIWVSNLVESANSRYSWTGQVYPDLPGNLRAGEYQYVLHPQERFEGKSVIKHFWGAFGKWGVEQLKRIERETRFDKENDEIWFQGAPKDNCWGWEEQDNSVRPRDPKKHGRVFLVSAPECYPIVSAKSFWEETRTPLLESLLKGNPIPWEKLSEDEWAIYLTGKFHKAFSLLEYFMGEKPMEMQKSGYAVAWANPLIELFQRLKPGDKLEELRGRDRPPLAKIPHQTFPALKAWTVYASFDGVKNIDSKRPTLNMSLQTRMIIEGALKHSRVKYFSSGQGLGDV